MSELDKIHAASARMTDVYHELRRLGHAFEETGNSVVSDRLRLMADDIEEARKEVNEAVGAMLDGRLRDARQGTANMLNLAVALLDRNAPSSPAQTKGEG